MTMQTGIWGHVRLTTPTTEAMQDAEEASLMTMMRCRHAGKSLHKRASLLGCMPHTDAVIFNPNTLRDLADIFETNVDKAFT